MAQINFPMTFANEPGPDGTVPVSRDWAFCRWLTVDVGVTAIPPSAFYIPEHKHLAHNLARFAYCKTDESIEEAKKRLAKLAASK
jgi:aspartate/methionine/tyrosine aminotransferase